MDQANLLSDISKNLSLLGNLFAQAGNSGTGAAGSDLFSSLLPQTSNLSIPVVQTQTSVPTPSTSAVTGGASASDSGTSADAAAQAADTLSINVQKLSDLAASLRKLMQQLRQKNANSDSNANQQAQAQSQTQSTTQTAVSSSTTSTPQSAGNTQNTNATNTAPSNDASVSSSTSSQSSATNQATPSATDAASAADAANAVANTNGTDPSQLDTTLNNIVAELLALVQMIVQNAQSVQMAKSSATPDFSLLAVSALQKSQNATASDLAGTDQGLGATAPASQTQGAQTAQSDGLQNIDAAMAADSLPNILSTIEKDLKQLLSATTDQAVANTASAANVGNNTTNSTSNSATIFDQLTSIENMLKQLMDTQRLATANAAASTKTTGSASTTPANSTATTSLVDQKNQTPLSVGERPLATTPSAPLAATIWSPPSVASTTTSAGDEESPNATLTTSVVAADGKAAASLDANNANLSGGDHFAQTAGGSATPTTTLMTAGGSQATGTYSFASTLSATRAENGGSTGLPSPVDQVILQLNRSVKQGNDQLSLQLHPSDLGKITIKLSFDGEGRVQGTVTADNPQTLDILQKDSRSLERALQDAGLQTDSKSLQFNLGQNSNNQNGQTANGSNNGNEANANGTMPASDEVGDGVIAAVTQTYYITPTGVNICV